MGSPDDAWNDTVRECAQQPVEAAHDGRWFADLISAIRCSGALLGLLLLIDWGGW